MLAVHIGDWYWHPLVVRSWMAYSEVIWARHHEEFETLPMWGPILDDYPRSTSICLKVFRVARFDHRASWAAKVRNVSTLGSQILSPLNEAPLLVR